MEEIRMSKKIYLSPSNQPSNTYCTGNTNEKAQMEALAGKVKAILDAEYDCETVMATLSMGIDLNGRPKEAKDKGCDTYIAIHSNAGGGGRASGTVGLYHPTSAASKALANAIINELNAVCPIKSNRSESLQNGMLAFSGAGYGEIRSPFQQGIVPVLIETNFHDNLATAQWILASKDAIARAYVNGIVKALGISKKQAAPVTPVTIYRVQVGAFSVKANADAMVTKLKAAGFDSFIV
jgi:N-acetylmuramoyl-L-alanine amidase